MNAVLAKYKQGPSSSSLGSLVQQTKPSTPVKEEKKSTGTLKPLSEYFGQKKQVTSQKPVVAKQAVKKTPEKKVAKLTPKPVQSVVQKSPNQPQKKTLKLTKVNVGAPKPEAQIDADAKAFEASTADLVSKSDEQASQLAADVQQGEDGGA